MDRHFDTFLRVYPEKYEPRLGFLRPIIPKVVNKFLDCGDLKQGFGWMSKIRRGGTLSLITTPNRL